MRKLFTATAAIALSVATMGGVAFADHHGSKMKDSKTVVDIAVGSPDHTTLVAAVKAAGLAETLSGDGPFTVFAPVNDAFAALPDGTVETLLMAENIGTLQAVLGCHVVTDEVMSTALVSMIEGNMGSVEVETLGPCTLTAMVDGGSVKIMDEAGNTATVTAADLDASNGVVHVIDTVLLPAG